MKITLAQGYMKNGETIKDIELKEKITIGMEEEALDMCIMLGKATNILTAEICSLAVAAGLTYDDVRNLHPYDYNLIKGAYNRFFFKNSDSGTDGTAGNGRNGKTREFDAVKQLKSLYRAKVEFAIALYTPINVINEMTIREFAGYIDMLIARNKK